MCISSANGGRLPPLPDVAFALRTSETETTALLEEMFTAQLFEKKESGIEPHNWRGRQFKSDVSTPRVKRHRKRSRNVSRNDTGNDDETANETHQNRTEQNRPPKPPKVCEYSAEFEIFWAAYPRKTVKGAAWKAWQKLNPDQDTQDLILKALIWQRTRHEWVKDGGQYIPHPASWLNGRGWEDEPQRTISTRPQAVVL